MASVFWLASKMKCMDCRNEYMIVDKRNLYSILTRFSIVMPSSLQSGRDIEAALHCWHEYSKAKAKAKHANLRAVDILRPVSLCSALFRCSPPSLYTASFLIFRPYLCPEWNIINPRNLIAITMHRGAAWLSRIFRLKRFIFRSYSE